MAPEGSDLVFDHRHNAAIRCTFVAAVDGRGRRLRGLAGSVGGPAAVDGQDDAGEVAGGGVGQEQGGAGDLGGLGPAAEGVAVAMFGLSLVRACFICRK